MKSALYLGIVLLIGVIVIAVAMGRAGSNNWPHIAEMKFGLSPTYSVQDLQTLLSNHKVEAAKFIYPGLFAYDLAFLFCIGGAVALLSIGLGGFTPEEPKGIWLVLILPVAYMAADLTENLLLSVLLSSDPKDPNAITAASVTLVQSFTIIKLATWALGNLQVLYLLARYCGWLPRA